MGQTSAQELIPGLQDMAGHHANVFSTGTINPFSKIQLMQVILTPGRHLGANCNMNTIEIDTCAISV